MKKIHFLGITVALLFVTTAVLAFGIPKTGNKVADKAIDVGKDQVNKAVVDDLNKKLTELTSSCKCNQNTGQITGCNFSKINKEIKNRQQAVKTFLNKNFRIKTEVNRACWVHLQNQVPSNSSYWSWWNSKWIKTEKVSISAVK